MEIPAERVQAPTPQFVCFLSLKTTQVLHVTGLSKCYLAVVMHLCGHKENANQTVYTFSFISTGFSVVNEFV